MARFLIPVFLAAFMAAPVKGGDFAYDASEVRVGILSKHLREVKEGKKNHLGFVLNGEVQGFLDPGGEAVRFAVLNLSRRDGRWVIEGDAFARESDFLLTIPRGQGTETAKVFIDGEVRHYPLPLCIRSSRGNLEITVTENVERYAWDTATAEYGHVPPEGEEALKALSAVVAARVEALKVRKSHEGFDFCDLTHCQVYRGRTSLERGGRTRNQWSINWNKMNYELLFHSRCGGKTLDHRVFSAGAAHGKGVTDRLYREGIILCDHPESCWEERVREDDIIRIMGGDRQFRPEKGMSFAYSTEKFAVTISDAHNSRTFSPETFRLAMNRRMGWNFIRSNIYEVSGEESEDGRVFVLEGCGLGHGVGLCQHGALELSRRGFSWGDILYHYYPDIELVRTSPGLDGSPEYSYVIFNLATGEIVGGSPAGMTERRIPPGSLFKIIVALYLSVERQDLFNDYRYTCTGKGDAARGLPERCWKTRGHGALGLQEALASSCNLYFASLHEMVERGKFEKFYRGFCKMLDIDDTMPKICSTGEFAALLSGIDFRIDLKGRDIIKIAGILVSDQGSDNRSAAAGSRFPLQYRARILKGLMNTYTRGTARFPSENPRTLKKRYDADFPQEMQEKLKNYVDGLWGKTSTVVSGTNVPLGCGIFLGGYRDRGVLLILRNGTGHLASQWGKLLLMREYSL